MEKAKPQRTCIVCRTTKDKKDLIRIVKFNDQISLDRTGKKNGRGAYVCNSQDCICKLKKGKFLNRAFSMEVKEETYKQIEEEFFGEQN